MLVYIKIINLSVDLLHIFPQVTENVRYNQRASLEYGVGVVEGRRVSDSGCLRWKPLIGGIPLHISFVGAIINVERRWEVTT
jgi:hypothetical protein